MRGHFDLYTKITHLHLRNFWCNSLGFHHRNIHQVAIEMYKVKNDLSPPFMKDLFSETDRESAFQNA